MTLPLNDTEGALRALLALREALDDATPAEAPKRALSALADRLDAAAVALSGGHPVPVMTAPSAAGEDVVAAALRAATGWTDAAQRHLTELADDLVRSHPRGQRRASAEPKPIAVAISSIGISVASRRRRASVMRACTTHSPGDVLVASSNRRMKVRPAHSGLFRKGGDRQIVVEMLRC